jgi:Ni,Fe-hydrogenase III large subunit/Ni,Fe-hydrogenase III component G
MNLDYLERPIAALPSNIPCSHGSVAAVEWEWSIDDLKAGGATFLSLWGTDDRDRDNSFRVRAAFLLPTGITVLCHRIENLATPRYSSIAAAFPAAARMERALYDLLGIASTARDRRGWYRHNAWPANRFPLRRDFNLEPRTSNLEPVPYPFVQVEGDGVHEIAVGPVHAGIIEPGHFRFSVVGEKVLRLEERLGYTHKGVANRFESLTQREGHRLAARISGDSAVAFSWAYCTALESIVGVVCPPRAASLRALALEHERLANHLGDLGALGNDAGFAFGLTHFSRLKEDLLRQNVTDFGERYLLNYIMPGGVAADLPESERRMRVQHYRKLEQDVLTLRSIYDEHAGLQDRFREAGQLDRELALHLGAVGLAARASGIGHDLRVDHPWAPYDKLATQMVTHAGGDVAARVQVRFDEILESLRLCEKLLADLPAGPIVADVPAAEADQLGIGLVEGWRGPVMIALETGPNSAIRRCHAHDPSWQNWPLLEHAILGNIVPDFPLINKSFNLSYSGQDG